MINSNNSISKLEWPPDVTDTFFRSGETPPNPSVNHNTYEMPSGLIERWKWIVGVENKLDQDIQNDYRTQSSVIGSVQARSIVQLKNQLQAHWHLDRKIKDYNTYKSDKIAEAKAGLISTIFYGSIGFFLKLYYNSSEVAIEKNLEARSKETYAKIGEFKKEGKVYDVVAFHLLADELSPTNDQNPQPFYSKDKGKTYISIIEREASHSFETVINSRENRHFQISIGREEKGTGKIFTESSDENPVVTNRRHLIVDGDLRYGDIKSDDVGSDPFLDDKLTQIMVEIFQQNIEANTLKVESHHSDFAVLTAGGFVSTTQPRKTAVMVKELEERIKEGNKLFPSFTDYETVQTSINTDQLYKDRVRFAKGEHPESWVEIIEQNKILYKGSSHLPDSWAKAPNISQ